MFWPKCSAISTGICIYGYQNFKERNISKWCVEYVALSVSIVSNINLEKIIINLDI